MDDHEYDKLLTEGQRIIEISISDHVWRAFKRAYDYTENNGRPFPKDGTYSARLECVMESHIYEITQSSELTDLFLEEALQQVRAEKNAEKEATQTISSNQEKPSTPGENI